MPFGYIRKKEGDEATLTAQRQALEHAGCEQLIEDSVAKGQSDQPELRRLLDGLREGDVVVVCRLDGLGRSLQDVVHLVQRIDAARAGFRSLAEAIDTTTASGRAVQAFGSLAALDRTVARNRVSAGLAAARAEGRIGGRRPKLTPGLRSAIVEDVLSGRRTAAQVARLHKVSQPTVSRLLAPYRDGVEMAGIRRPSNGDIYGSDRILGLLPVSALDERVAIVGTSGSGKTYAAKGLVERLMDRGERVCVVDPLGVWWGLRAGADGSAASGYPVVVFGGRHADVPLDAGMGLALGRLIGTHPLACVVDVSDLGSSTARRVFMTAFAETLYGTNTEPLHLVLDEADLWAPQRAQPHWR